MQWREDTRVTNKRVFPAQLQGPGRIPITNVKSILLNITMIVIVMVVLVMVVALAIIMIRMKSTNV